MVLPASAPRQLGSGSRVRADDRHDPGGAEPGRGALDQPRRAERGDAEGHHRDSREDRRGLDARCENGAVSLGEADDLPEHHDGCGPADRAPHHQRSLDAAVDGQPGLCLPLSARRQGSALGRLQSAHRRDVHADEQHVHGHRAVGRKGGTVRWVRPQHQGAARPRREPGDSTRGAD